MKPEIFVKNWVNEFSQIEKFSTNSVDALNVSDKTKEYLKYGLPIEAAPFLNFGPQNGAELQSAKEMYALETNFDIYKVIGFNSYGDPICINDVDGSIVYLNHDDKFGLVYINKSLETFLTSLLLFRDFMNYKNNNSKLKVRSRVASLKNEFNKLDPNSLNNGLWSIEFEELSNQYSIVEILKSIL